MKIEILSEPADVAEFVRTVQQQADAHKKALGFLPKRVYSEAALQSKLLVAALDRKKRKEYAGHLLFGGIFPRGRIFQIFVPARYRRNSVGEQLLRSLIARMEAAHYLSISAHVAADLTQANAFWNKMGFAVIQTRAGGRSRGRTLNIRVRDLNTPNLFNFTDLIAVGDAADLHLVERLFAQSPVYVIDLNVLFDVTKQRIRAKEAGLVMSAGFRNIVRVAVSEEFVEELRRTSIPKPEDPILALALELPRLKPPGQAERGRIVQSLEKIVFPARSAGGGLTIQDRSDLMHLATAIYHRAAGFVTAEKPILQARRALQKAHGIDVIGVREFAETMRSSSSEGGAVLRARLQGVEVCATEVSDQNREYAEAFLRNMNVPQQQILDASGATRLDVPARRVLLTTGEQVIGFGSWALPRGPNPVSDAFVCVDQDSQATESAAEYLISRICKECSQAAPALIRLRQMQGHTVTLRLAMAHGFRATEGFQASDGVLQKIAIGRPIHDSNWGWVRSQLRSIAGVGLPEAMPTDVLSDRIFVTSPNGRRVHTTLTDLEALLSPVLFLSDHRDGTVVPIRREFADLLLEARQFRLLESPEATWLNERNYFSSSRTASIIVEGGPLLFYESGKRGGQSAVVAVARAARVSLEPKRSISIGTRRRGVLEARELERIGADKEITVTRFDNLMMLARPVSLARLRQLGCADASNFVTAKRLTGAQIVAILQEGGRND